MTQKKKRRQHIQTSDMTSADIGSTCTYSDYAETVVYSSVWGHRQALQSNLNTTDYIQTQVYTHGYDG